MIFEVLHLQNIKIKLITWYHVNRQTSTFGLYFMIQLFHQMLLRSDVAYESLLTSGYFGWKVIIVHPFCSKIISQEILWVNEYAKWRTKAWQVNCWFISVVVFCGLYHLTFICLLSKTEMSTFVTITDLGSSVFSEELTWRELSSSLNLILLVDITNISSGSSYESKLSCSMLLAGLGFDRSVVPLMAEQG